ncbi:MAG: hypothetical protein N839_0003690 [Desulfofustis sp. PB-SRB1]|jgi:hypothetical protein|nr:hypothetical protein [Desulfofustis sp. PB-SRB1]MBM1001495.1 hypothetical protein [Desulfofustis sp. PB-SRB1]
MKQADKKTLRKDPNDSSRRQAVKTIVGGVSTVAAYHLMPAKWSTPLIESIMLPVHAAASGLTLSDPCSVAVLSGTTASAEITIRIDGFVTPSVGALDTVIEIIPQGAGNPVRLETVTADDGTFSEQIVITGGPGITGLAVTTSVQGATGAANCSIALSPSSGPDPDPNPDPPEVTDFMGEYLSGNRNKSNVRYRLVITIDPAQAGVPIDLTMQRRGGSDQNKYELPSSETGFVTDADGRLILDTFGFHPFGAYQIDFTARVHGGDDDKYIGLSIPPK